jgi:hypothetical protein
VSERLYELLPLVYRVRDAEAGEPLRALLSVLEQEVDLLEAETTQLYNDWFIETCRPYVASYIADLVGVTLPEGACRLGWDPRPFVADAIAVRRRKGTPAAVRVAAQGLTGQSTVCIECERLIGITQPVAHVRPERGRRPDLRDPAWLVGLGGLFSNAARTIDVSGRRRGTYAGPIASRATVDLTVWRGDASPATGVNPACVAPGRFVCHPFGIDVPLVAPRRSGADRWEPLAPGQVTRAVLRTDGAERWRAHEVVENRALDSSLGIWIVSRAGELTRVSGTDMSVLNLADWRHQSSAPVAIDPQRGRLSIAPSWPHAEAELLVSYSWSAPTRVGGGAYRRSLAEEPVGRPRITVSRDAHVTDAYAGAIHCLDVPSAFAKLRDAGGSGTIVVLDSRTYTLDRDVTLTVPDGGEVVLTAAPGVTPTLTGTLYVRGHMGGRFVADGLWFDGTLDLDGLDVTIRHCTFNPARDVSIVITSTHPSRLALAAVIGGRLRLSGAGVTLEAVSSVLTAVESGTTATDEISAHMRRVTMLGTVTVTMLAAEDCIFASPVRASRSGVGGVRFSYVAPGSEVTTQHCLPSAAAHAVVAFAPVVPVFVSRTFGQPGYARLSAACPEPLLRLASDGGEPGAWSGTTHMLERLAAVADFLPAGTAVSVRVAD